VEVAVSTKSMKFQQVCLKEKVILEYFFDWQGTCTMNLFLHVAVINKEKYKKVVTDL
jgi:hypothetical protein